MRVSTSISFPVEMVEPIRALAVKRGMSVSELLCGLLKLELEKDAKPEAAVSAKKKVVKK